ncbi:MAG: hypothetical protein J2P50_17700 [Hyphomicrobiaceae bacterium]|nr:hypothetical protein [Hyphomicrobiaceae bacterium]
MLRLAGIARALCLDPVVLVCDESAAGLRIGEKKALAILLRELRADGVSVLLVEHHRDFVMSVADRLAALDFGTKIGECPPAKVSNNPAGCRPTSEACCNRASLVGPRSALLACLSAISASCTAIGRRTLVGHRRHTYALSSAGIVS